MLTTMPTAVFICEANIKQFGLQLLEVRPDVEKAFIRTLLFEEERKLLDLHRELLAHPGL